MPRKHNLGPIGTSTHALGTHFGAVRSFELGGTSTTAVRRWAARCSCGVVATTGAWPEALAYLSEHRRAAPDPRPTPVPNRPMPDLRGVAYRPIDVVRPAVNGHRPPALFLRQLVAGVLHSIVRLTVGAFSTGA
jgi:hypothetical protein